MPEIDLEAIRARAEAAGGSDAQWHHVGEPSGHLAGRIVDQSGNVVVYDEGAPSAEQAEHIAGLSPAVVLALLDVIDDMKR